MKEFILIIRLPLSYGSEQAQLVKEKWDNVLQKWKSDSIFVTSYVAPNEGYVLSGSERTVRKEVVVSNNVRVVTSIILLGNTLEEIMERAKACPILDQGGTVEIKEVKPRLP